MIIVKITFDSIQLQSSLSSYALAGKFGVDETTQLIISNTQLQLGVE
jgi:L-cysteine desulfidase